MISNVYIDERETPREAKLAATNGKVYLQENTRYC